MRIGEALALLPKDIDFASGAILVLHVKGDKARTAALTLVLLSSFSNGWKFVHDGASNCGIHFSATAKANAWVTDV